MSLSSAHEITTKLELPNSSLLVNRRQPPPVVQQQTDLDSTPSITNPAFGYKKNEDTVPSSTSAAFPTSKTYESRCNPCRRLACSSLVDIDELILRQERDQLRLMMQPVEEEEIPIRYDTTVELCVDIALSIPGMKQPKSCGTHPAASWAYQIWQIMVLAAAVCLTVLPPLLRQLCIGSTSDMTNRYYFCSDIQLQLARSNYTRHIDGYAGALNTMLALGESDLEAHRGFKFSTWFNHSTLDPVNPQFLRVRKEFIQWRSLTHSSIPLFVYFLFTVWTSLVLPVSLMFIFSSRLKRADDPIEIMYPALLESKNDVENGRKNFFFVHPKRVVIQTALYVSLGLFPIMTYMMDGFLKCGLGCALLFTVLVGIAFSAILSITLSGIVVQITNATFLSNMLIQLCSNTTESNQRRQEDHQHQQQTKHFDAWKEYYKTTVGALHIWSWRMTPFFGSFIIYCLLATVFALINLIFMFLSIKSEHELEESEQMDVFKQVGAMDISALFIFTIMLILFTGAMSMVSARYKRLHLLIATLRLPKHQLDDFVILRNQNAALTIFDYPITSSTVYFIVRLFFIQVAFAAISVAGAN